MKHWELENEIPIKPVVLSTVAKIAAMLPLLAIFVIVGVM